MPEIPYLSPADVAILKEVVSYYRGRRPEQLRGQTDEDEVLAPEVYIALTPEDGIGGRVDLNPGFAECPIYRIVNNLLVPIETLSHLVYNLSSSSIDGDEYVDVKRDKFGTWIAGSGGGGGGSGAYPRFLARLTDKTYAFGWIRYAWERVLESTDPAPLEFNFDPTPINSGSFLENPAFHIDNVDLPLPQIVWLSRAKDGINYLIDNEPRWEAVRKTDDTPVVIDGVTYWPGVVMIYDQTDKVWVDGEEVLLIDGNA